MNIDIKEENGTFLVALSGWIDTNVASEFMEALKPLIAKAGSRIVIDCKELEYMCSLGLRGLLTLKKESAAKGGTLILAHVGGEFQKILTMTGFVKLFDFE